jgi:hypothetical protein
MSRFVRSLRSSAAEASMSLRSRVIAISAILISGAVFTEGQANKVAAGPAVDSKAVNCLIAPCLLSPTQASEGGALVNTPPIAINPLNPKELLVGSNDYNCPNGGTGAHLSMDGGTTWSVTCMANLVTERTFFEPGGEPEVGFDCNGVAYIASTYTEERYNLTSFIGFEKSYDGVHWSNPRVALNVNDSSAGYTGFAVDTNPGSPYLNALYVSAVAIDPEGYESKEVVVVSHSNDGSKTWKKVGVASAQTSPDVDSNTSMTVGRDGTAYLTWMYCNSGFYFCEDDDAFMVFSKSMDGGNTWSKPKLMATVVLNHGALPNSKVGVSNYPAIGVDNSDGPNAGTLYVSMYNWTGSFMQVQVVRSTDGGETWSKPVPVAPGITHDQFFPWISVSPTGLVGISWLDRRNDPANVDYQAFAAVSTDGGQTFQPNVQLTTAFSNPNVNGSSSGEFMGEYTGNAWDGPNYFVAAWMDSSNGVDMQAVVGGIRLK